MDFALKMPDSLPLSFFFPSFLLSLFFSLFLGFRRRFLTIVRSFSRDKLSKGSIVERTVHVPSANVERFTNVQVTQKLRVKTNCVVHRSMTVRMTESSIGASVRTRRITRRIRNCAAPPSAGGKVADIDPRRPVGGWCFGEGRAKSERGG